MIESENNQNFNNEKKKKTILIVLFWIIFLVPFCFGIAKLLPGCSTPTVSYEVKLTNDYGGGLTLSKSKAYPENNFSADISINRSIVNNKIMPDALGASDVLCNDEAITYTYNISVDRFSARINIPKENIKGNISINVPLVTPMDTFPITLKGNGGEFSNHQTTITLEAYAGAKLVDLADYTQPSGFREGYHFTHWELESDRTQKLEEDDEIPYTPGGVTYLANCELNEIKVTINPGSGAFPGKTPGQSVVLNTLYDTEIKNIDKYPGEPALSNNTFLYYVDNNNKKYSVEDTVTIPGLELELTAVYREDLHITLEANGGVFPSGATTEFNTYKGITLAELEGYLEPTNGNQDFTYWTYNGSNYYQNTVLDLAGNITLTANYVECEHEEFTGYTIANNQLYGICENCGAQILITDDKLLDYEHDILIANYQGEEFNRKSISDLPSIISTIEKGTTLDVYLINGVYGLAGGRTDGEVTINLYGLMNNENEINATVDCAPYSYPREMPGINFVMNNLNMKGAQRYDAGFYLGLYANTVTYNNCHFTGKQSAYSNKVIFNDCTFSSTNFEDKPDYAIYGYNSHDVEFNRCDFLSDGKAIKIYSEGSLIPDAKYTYKFTDCNFKINELIGDKAAIQVDSIAHATTPYNVYITRCHQTGYVGGLYNDSSTHANFIVTEI